MTQALVEAKATLEAQQALVRAAEDRSLRSHLEVQKTRKRERDALVKSDDRVAQLEEEIGAAQKQLAQAKRQLRKERKRAKAEAKAEAKEAKSAKRANNL